MLCNSIMADDFKNKGICQYFLVDDILSSYSVHTVLPKNSPYTEIISQGYDLKLISIRRIILILTKPISIRGFFN